MDLRFSTAEYAVLCKVADLHHTKPAQWCHDHIMSEALRQYRTITAWEREGGSLGGPETVPDPPGSRPPGPGREADG